MRVDVYTRHDAFIRTVAGADLLGFVHTDELNGSDSVEITTTFRLCEGYRLIWKDRLGKVHEHVCQDPEALRSDSGVVYRDTALNSICELMGDYIDDRRPYGYSFRRALEVCLEPTRWKVGTVDKTGTVSDGLTFYHTDCRTALNAILECGGELETEISVASNGAITRKVSILQHRGETGGHRRFEYGKDLTSISRTEHWGAITACYGYGKGLETDNGGYGRKLTFGDVNGGKDYVEDATALKTYGRPDGNGGFAHVFGKYENSQCEDASQLKSETKAYLDEHKEPGVTYEASVVDLVAMGRTWEGVQVGDDVQIVDTCFDPVLRCEGRVSKLVTDLLGSECDVTLGNVTETLADIWERQQGQISGLVDKSSSWDVAASTPGAYLQQLIDGLNEQFNTMGMSYCFTSFEQGTIWSSVPLDANGKPTKTGGSAIQICSQGFRIASGTKSDGSYDWRTFGTGKGFTADEITTGTLNADLIRAGTIQDVRGRNSWNLETGQLTTNGIVAKSADVSGKITATTGKIGGFNINFYSISNDVMTLASNGLRLERNGKEIGLIGTNGLKADNSKSGLNFDLEDTGDYMTWAARKTASADTYSMFLAYAKVALPMEGGGSWDADTIHIARDVNFHNYALKNAFIDPDSGGADGGITATINFVQVLEMNSDGTVARWGSNARMVFKRGMLVDLTYYS